MGKKTLLSATVYVTQIELDALKNKANQEQLTISNFLRQKLGFNFLLRGRKQKSNLINAGEVKSTVISSEIKIDSMISENKSTVEKLNENKNKPLQNQKKQLQMQPLFEFLDSENEKES